MNENLLSLKYQQGLWQALTATKSTSLAGALQRIGIQCSYHRVSATRRKIFIAARSLGYQGMFHYP